MKRYPRNGVCRMLGLCMAVVLCFALTLTIPAAEDAEVVESAATVQITKTEGTVSVTNAAGRAISRLTKLRLYSGYHLNTDQKSYAWIALDGERLAKADAATGLEIRKKGKALELLLQSGSVYFDIADPLEDDESLNICTSSMIIGIRGTCGWVDVVDQYTSVIHVLEGTVSCTVFDPVSGEVRTIYVHGGESVTASVLPEGGVQELVAVPFETDDVRGFILKELVENAALCQRIFESSGLDFRNMTPAEAARRQAQDEAKAINDYREMMRKLARQAGLPDISDSSDSGSGGSGGGGIGGDYNNNNDVSVGEDLPDDNDIPPGGDVPDNDVPPGGDGFDNDGYFAEWINVPHFDVGYNGPESGVESKSAIYVEDGTLYGHVMISHPGIENNLSGRFLEDIRLSFNGDVENDMAGGLPLDLVMQELGGTIAGMDSPAPDGENTYIIYNSNSLFSDDSLGVARSFVSVGRDEMEFEINLERTANQLGVYGDSLWVFAVQYRQLGPGWATTAGVPTGVGAGLALCLSSVGLGYVLKRRKNGGKRKK